MKDRLNIFKEEYRRIFSNNERISGYYLPECTSTMDIGRGLLNDRAFCPREFLFSPLESNEADIVLILAGEQTKGRGRRNRSWESSADGGMYLTILDYRPRLRSSLSGFSLVLGYGIYKALSELGVSPALKWPNDVLQKEKPHKKFSGILVETFPGSDPDNCYIVTGIGVNINQSEFGIDIPATSIRIQKREEAPYEASCLKVISSILEVYEEFFSSGFKTFMTPWWDASLHHGAKVTCEYPAIEGEVEGVSEEGALLVRSGGKLHSIVSGDVLLKHQFA